MARAPSPCGGGCLRSPVWKFSKLCRNFELVHLNDDFNARCFFHEKKQSGVSINCIKMTDTINRTITVFSKYLYIDLEYNKLCTIIYRCLHQTAHVYLQDLCVPVSTTASRRYLRSAARGDLQVLSTKTVTFGTRSFASSAPKLWNSLPLPLRDSTLTLRRFSSRLKTHLFSLAYRRAS